MPIKSDAKKFVNSMENRRTRSFDNRDLSTLRNSAEYTSFEHPLVSAVMREALNRVARKFSNVSITYECAVGEADPLVVYRCIQKNGYSVIGNDTDFLGVCVEKDHKRSWFLTNLVLLFLFFLFVYGDNVSLFENSFSVEFAYHSFALGDLLLFLHDHLHRPDIVFLSSVRSTLHPFL